MTARNLSLAVVLAACAAGPKIREQRLPSGQLLERATYAGDTREGEYASFYSDGTHHASGRYVAGKRDGMWREWHENGKPWLEGAYRAGVRTGPWVEYDYTGKKMFEGTFVNGRVDGAWRSYGYDGVDRASGTAADGRLEGRLVIYMRDGGRYEETWHANQRDGTVTGYDAKGEVTETTEFRNGVEVKGGDGAK